MERELDAGKITDTSRELRNWINKEFPNAHLSQVAAEVHAFAKQAVTKAARIRRPFWLIRLATCLLIGTLVAGLAYEFYSNPKEVLKLLDDSRGAVVYVFAVVVVVFTLETRWKRRRATLAIAEIRAIAHIVDMHQIAKDPAMEHFRDNNQQDKIIQYLHACTCLLALLSKIAELYIEHFPDPAATAEVNNFEVVVAGMRSMIWMKILSMTGNATASMPMVVPSRPLARA